VRRNFNNGREGNTDIILAQADICPIARKLPDIKKKRICRFRQLLLF
jgi:hypothetical protein